MMPFRIPISPARLLPLLLLPTFPSCAVATEDEQAQADAVVVGDGGSSSEGGGSHAGSGGRTVVVVMTGGSASAGGATPGGGGAEAGTGGGEGGGGDPSAGGSQPDGGASGTGGTASGGMGTGGVGPGGAASGGAGTGGAASECPVAAFNSDNYLNTTGPACFIAEQSPANDFQVYRCDGRTITINGAMTAPGNKDWNGVAPYTIEFSPGADATCAFAFW